MYIRPKYSREKGRPVRYTTVNALGEVTGLAIWDNGGWLTVPLNHQYQIEFNFQRDELIVESIYEMSEYLNTHG